MFARLFAPAILMLSAFSLAAHADSLVYTLSGNFTGTLGGSSFTNAFGTFSETTDPSGVTSIGQGFYQNPGSVTLNLTGYAPITFGTTYLYVESEYNTASFYDLQSGFAVGDYSDAIGGYDLATGIGPVNGTFVSTGAISESTTSYGDLIITGGRNVTFQADAVPAATPEPSSLLLLSTGLLGMAGIVRSRFVR